MLFFAERFQTGADRLPVPSDTDIDYNDVRPDLLNVFVTDHIVGIAAAEQAAPFVVSGNNEFEYLPCALVEFKVAYLAQFLAVFEIDDFLFL